MDAAQIPMELAQGGRAADTSIFSGATQAMPQRAESAEPMNIGVKPFPGLDVNAEQQKAYSLAEAKGAYDEEQPKREARIRDRETLTPYAHKLATAKGVQEVLDGMGDRLAPETVQELTKRRLELEKGDISLYQARLKGDSAKWEMKDDQERRAVDALAPAAEVYRSTLLETKDLAKAQQAYDSAKQEAIPQLAQLKDPITGQPLFPPDKITALQQMPADKLDMMVKTLHGYNERSADIAKRVKLEADASRSQAVAKYGSGYKGQMLARMQAQLQTKVDRGEIGQADMDKQLLDYEKTALGGAAGSRAGMYSAESVPEEQREQTAQLMVEGKYKMSGFEARTPLGKDILSRALKKDPSFDMKTYDLSAKTLKEFTSGPEARGIRALNVAVDHMKTLDELVVALDNRDMNAMNVIGNAVEKEWGESAPTNFDAARDLVAKEITKAVVANGGGEREREELAKTMSRANSPDQLRDVVQTYRKLLGGQLMGMRQQFMSGIKGSTQADFDRLLRPESRKALEPGKGTPAGFPRVDMEKATAGDSDEKQSERAHMQDIANDSKATPAKRKAAAAAVAAIDQELQGKEITRAVPPGTAEGSGTIILGEYYRAKGGQWVPTGRKVQ